MLEPETKVYKGSICPASALELQNNNNKKAAKYRAGKDWNWHFRLKYLSEMEYVKKQAPRFLYSKPGKILYQKRTVYSV
jgi:hypothetical protein